MAKKLISFVIPAYKEEATIVEAMNRLLYTIDQNNINAEILIVVDGSPDSTAQQARSISDRRVRVIDYPNNLGKGNALKVGCFALAHSEYICFLDADLDLHPESVWTLLSILEKNEVDAVVGSKRHKLSVVDYPLIRRIQSQIFKVMIRLLFSLDVGDTQTGLKVFRYELIRACVPEVHTQGYAFDLELLVVAKQKGYSVLEGPVVLDFQFSSTTNLPAVLEMIKEVVRIKRRHKS